MKSEFSDNLEWIKNYLQVISNNIITSCRSSYEQSVWSEFPSVVWHRCPLSQSSNATLFLQNYEQASDVTYPAVDYTYLDKHRNDWLYYALNLSLPCKLWYNFKGPSIWPLVSFEILFPFNNSTKKEDGDEQWGNTNVHGSRKSCAVMYNYCSGIPMLGFTKTMKIYVSTAISPIVISIRYLPIESYNNNNNNINNIYWLQLGCHPVAVVILHVYKIWNRLLLNLSREGYMRSM